MEPRELLGASPGSRRHSLDQAERSQHSLAELPVRRNQESLGHPLGCGERAALQIATQPGAGDDEEKYGEGGDSRPHRPEASNQACPDEREREHCPKQCAKGSTLAASDPVGEFGERGVGFHGGAGA